MAACTSEQSGIVGVVVFFQPVVRRIIREVEARSRVPFLAGATLPTQACEVVKRNRCPGVSDAPALIASGAEQRNLRQLLRFIIPSSVSGAYQFTIVAPRVRKRVLRGRLISIEPQPCSLA